MKRWWLAVLLALALPALATLPAAYSPLVVEAQVGPERA